MTSQTNPKAFRRSAQMPGAEEDANQFVTDEKELDPRDAEIASLKAELAARPANTSPAVTVYEYETPQGKLAREASAFGHLTVAQLVNKIDAGEAREPATSCLCIDGWYARRA
jgi:hypothetical protein